MIDFHTHILPNIDDGSRSIEETFNLIEEAKQAGFDKIVLTPHYIIDTNYMSSKLDNLSKLSKLPSNHKANLSPVLIIFFSVRL